eukprot:TRINITY_DN21144_c0_g1_i2.p1 TRINITY_DN21144_c0_g1~~TRINITY_DN21144_c0_g1_i2.p1  ORF type:complete len:406 (+),score=64.26 TRINITY_DN21144_c0_g1_i2:67-1284(+)
MSTGSALEKIASLLDKREAVALFLQAVTKEESGDCDAAIKLYRRAFRMWSALDSGPDDVGLPQGVRAEALAAGIDYDALTKVSLDMEPSPRFDVGATEQWMSYLDEHGYCVLKGAADVKAVDRAKCLMWDFLERVPGTAVRRDDMSTWEKDWLPSSSNGILGRHGFGQSAFCWHTRLLPKVRQAFSEIWKSDDLLVSFDGGNVFRPWTQKQGWRTEGSWWHLDQNALLPGNDGRVCVQGFVTFTDATPSTGGLCVIPGSHRQHKEVCERSCSRRNFVPVASGDPVLESGGKLVLAQAGDLVLWDSRCVHCNAPGSLEAETPSAEDEAKGIERGEGALSPSELLRVVGYVCMTPAAWASQSVLDNRKNAFIRNVTLGHCPHECHADGEGPAWLPPKEFDDLDSIQK